MLPLGSVRPRPWPDRSMVLRGRRCVHASHLLCNLTFIAHLGLPAQILASMLDSLVRVSRRVVWAHEPTSSGLSDGPPAALPLRTGPGMASAPPPPTRVELRCLLSALPSPSLTQVQSPPKAALLSLVLRYLAGKLGRWPMRADRPTKRSCRPFPASQTDVGTHTGGRSWRESSALAPPTPAACSGLKRFPFNNFTSFSLSLQSAFHLSLTVLVRYRSLTRI